MMQLSSRTKELLEIQQQKYFRSLPQKRTSIRQAWNIIQGEGLTSVNTEQLRLQVHKLAGSAGSYGLQELGRAARKLDQVLGSGEYHALSTREISAPMADLLKEFDRLVSAGLQ